MTSNWKPKNPYTKVKYALDGLDLHELTRKERELVKISRIAELVWDNATKVAQDSLVNWLFQPCYEHPGIGVVFGHPMTPHYACEECMQILRLELRLDKPSPVIKLDPGETVELSGRLVTAYPENTSPIYINPSVPPDCHRWHNKHGNPTHYCLGVSISGGLPCPPPLHGCEFAQYKPVYHRMKKR